MSGIKRAAISAALVLTGCVTQQYWVRPGSGVQQVAADLQECRLSTSKALTQQVYTADQLEGPCMVAKGYSLSNRPPG